MKKLVLIIGGVCLFTLGSFTNSNVWNLKSQDFKIEEVTDLSYHILVDQKDINAGDHFIKTVDKSIDSDRKFKEKIIYLTFDEIPSGIEEIFENESEGEKSRKLILNAAHRENGQRNYISKGLENAQEEDLVLISDVDEIPNLQNLKLKEIKNEIILFKQDMFYYKFNLKLPNIKWVGTKACKFKNFKNPQWLRNVKDRKYKFYRLDTLFSETKYQSIEVKKNGGWHFTNIKTAEEIKHKLNSYLHHNEFEKSSLGIEDIQDIISNQKTIYNLKADKRVCLLYTSPSPRDRTRSRMPSSA